MVTSKGTFYFVARCEGGVINRSLIPDLYHDMEECSSFTGDLEYTLFDRHDRLKKEHIEHPTKKGSGIWGAEMNTGYLIFLSGICVDEFHRRKGLGKRMVEATIHTIQGTYTEQLLAIFSPDVLVAKLRADAGDTPYTSAHEDNLKHMYTGFVRKAGFRRIGHTPYFALATNPSHPCHRLLASDDPNTPYPKPKQSAAARKVESFEAEID